MVDLKGAGTGRDKVSEWLRQKQPEGCHSMVARKRVPIDSTTKAV